MLIKNETRTEIEKKNFRKLRRRLEIIEQILAFFLVYFLWRNLTKKTHWKFCRATFAWMRPKMVHNAEQPCLVCGVCSQWILRQVSLNIFCCFFFSLFTCYFFGCFILGLPFLVCMRQGWFVLKRIRQSWNLYILFPAVWLTFGHLAPPRHRYIYVSSVITVCKYKQIGKADSHLLSFVVCVWPYLIAAG